MTSRKQVVVENWADAILVQDAIGAIKVGSTLTPAELTKGMYALPQGTTLGGLTPPLSLPAGQDDPQWLLLYGD